MSSDETLHIADDSRGPKHLGALIRELEDERLLWFIAQAQRDAETKLVFDEQHLSPSLHGSLEEIRSMILNLARAMIDDWYCDDGHPLAWFDCPSYRHLCAEAEKRGLRFDK